MGLSGVLQIFSFPVSHPCLPPRGKLPDAPDAVDTWPPSPPPRLPVYPDGADKALLHAMRSSDRQRTDRSPTRTRAGNAPSESAGSARSVERVVLVDGQRLAELMIENEIGVTARIVKIPKIDSDYFDEESS
jgi:hypothetical protein